MSTGLPQHDTHGNKGWIAVDLDGTLAMHDPRHGVETVGRPIEAIVQRIHTWRSQGFEVRVFTARASEPELLPPLQEWLAAIGLGDITVTNRRDYNMVQVWDDRVVQVACNTGEVLTPRECISIDANGWIGVELDGTLAEYHTGQDPMTIGAPVAKMRSRVQQWLMVDIDVRLFSARAADPAMEPVIRAWLKEQRLEKMTLACEKDFAMSQFWDDRGVHVLSNRGEFATQATSMDVSRKFPTRKFPTY